MNTTPSRIRWRIAPEKSDAEDRGNRRFRMREPGR